MLSKSDGVDGGWLVKCDGCGRETLAEVFPDRIVVYDTRHGRRHIAVIPKCELLKIMGSCLIGVVPGKECTGQSSSAMTQN